MVANREIKRGEELFDSYGEKCNWKFLHGYGFVLEDNECNTAPITIEIDPTDPLKTEKEMLISMKLELS